VRVVQRESVVDGRMGGPLSEPLEVPSLVVGACREG